MILKLFRSENNKARIIHSISWKFIIPLLLLLGVVTGFILADDYGMSWDEPINYQVGVDAVKAFRSATGYSAYLSNGEAISHHGPSYFMLSSIISRGLDGVKDSWGLADGRHLVNFVAFSLGVVSFYLIALRLVERRYALLTTLLFATQPLIFGHGFINQKDTPFLAFFLLCIALGMLAADRMLCDLEVDESQSNATNLSFKDQAMHEWKGANKKVIIPLLLLAGGLILFAIDALFSDTAVSYLNHTLVAAYDGRAREPLQFLFDLFAEDAYKTPIAAYEAKLTWAYWIYGRLITIFLVIGVIWITARMLFPQTWKRIWRGSRINHLTIILAGSMLGFTISIRSIGAFAGLLVGIYIIYRLKQAAIGPLLIYMMAACLVMFITWPYLWDNPVGRLFESVMVTSNFYANPTLYWGETVRADALPWHYLPTYVAVQLTEPVLPLFIIGIGVVIWRLKNHSVDKILMVILTIWLVLPIFFLLTSNMGVSGNIRQLLFLLPPVFYIAGIGLARILQILRARWVQVTLGVAILLPGVIGVLQLHPYQYAYFNSFVGGVESATGQFHTDNLCTSYREAMQHINSIADEGDLISVFGPVWVAEPYAREDLTLISENSRWERADYLLTCQWWVNRDLEAYGFRLISEVGREGGVFASIYMNIGEN